MSDVHGVLAGGNTNGDLLGDAVRDVRLRWRLKHALRGAAIAIVAVASLFIVLSIAMRGAHYSDGAVLFARAAAVVGSLAAIWYLVVRPLRATPDESRVALYVEEHERTFGGAFITAVEVNSRAADRVAAGGIAARLVRSALDGLRRAESGKRVDGADLKKAAGLFFSTVVGAALIFASGPTMLRTGAQLLMTPWAGTDTGRAFSIRVAPGDATIAKGGDQMVAATLNGFTAERAELLVKGAGAAGWTRLGMAADSSGRWAFRLFDVSVPTKYAVEAAGIRSPTFTLLVAPIPYVAKMDLEYRYPAYTQLAARRVDSTGDIAALIGTMVRVRVTPTVPAKGGQLLVDGGDTLRLAPTADGSLVGMMRVTKSGFYKVALDGTDGRPVSASLDYTIDALPDRKPSVAIGRPGRDVKVLSVDEVFSDTKSEDDYGVSRLELIYSVNGGAERTVGLFSATARALREVAAGHTFMLEDMKLQPGDQVAYYAKSTDNNAVSGPGSATTDMYFLTVRPYDMDYRQGQGGGGGGGGGRGGQQENPSRLSEQQRQVISATFNLARDSATLDAKTLAENVATVRLAQQKLKEQTAVLAERLVTRGVAAQDSGFRKIAQILPRAVAQMDSAERKLVPPGQRSALPSEQKALTELGRAEAVFREIQIQQQQGGGGGGGGGGAGGANAEDLADIFELQQDRLRNQYEAVQRGETTEQRQQDSTASTLDETAEKLRQLAARQLQQDMRAQRKADSLGRMGQSGASTGDNGRQLAQEAEQAARQLERLARERQSQPLADAARRLQDAADQMRQSAANGRQGAANSRSAADRLNEARRLLEQERNGQAGRDIEAAQQQQRRLAEAETHVQEGINKLEDPKLRRDSVQRAIQAQKNQMAGEVRALTSQLDRLATENAREQPNVSRALRGAADTLRNNRVADRMQMSGQSVATAPQQWLNEIERQIGTEIGDLGRRLQQAAGAAEQGQQAQAGAQAADRMRDLVRGLESVQERMRQEQERRLGQGQQGQNQQGGQQQNGQPQSTQNTQTGQQQGQQGRQGQGQGQQGQGQVGGGNGGGGNRQFNNGGKPGFNSDRFDPQQTARELQQRIADAEAIARDLRRQGQDVTPLDRAIEGMKMASTFTSLEDKRAESTLRTQVVEGLKAYEFALRRANGDDAGTRVLLERSGEVPPAFKAMVEEYYRSLSRTPKKPQP